MSFKLPQQIGEVPGRPSKVRIGTVTEVSPLLVSVQGTDFSGVGVLDSYTPNIGDTVALLGQSAVSTDQSSWVVLGKVNNSNAAVSRTASRLLYMAQVTAAGDQTATSVSTAITGLSIGPVNFDTDATFEALVALDARAILATNTTLFYQVYQNGVGFGSVGTFSNGGVNGARASVFQAWQGTIAANTDTTFTVQFSRVGGADNVLFSSSFSTLTVKVYGA